MNCDKINKRLKKTGEDISVDDRLARHKQYARDNTPAKYRQPVSEYYGRKVENSVEEVDFIPGTHLRIWYNIQHEGYEMHHHSATEIILCVDKGYTVFADSRTYVLQKGDILFIPPNILHRLLGSPEGARFIFLFDLSPFEQFRDFATIAPIMNAPLLLSENSHSELYRSIHERMIRITDLYFENRGMWEFEIYSILMNVYWLIAQDHYARTDNFAYADKPGNKKNYEKFSSLLLYVSEHFAEDLTLDEAAEYVGFSKYHFTRLFKEYTGMTFYDHLVSKRVQAAQKLLGTDASITDISFRTGFNSLTSFSRSFRKYTGLSPSEYRQTLESFEGHISQFTRFDDE